MIPFSGNIHWEAVKAALKAIHYTGEITFEVFGFLKKLPDELLPGALQFMAQIGRYLAGE